MGGLSEGRYIWRTGGFKTYGFGRNTLSEDGSLESKYGEMKKEGEAEYCS